MGFKTFTCCICGKEGLTKPQSYAIEGKGRACREHQEAQSAHESREEKQKEHMKKLDELKNLTSMNREAPKHDCIRYSQFTLIPDSTDHILLMKLQIDLHLWKGDHQHLCLAQFCKEMNTIIDKEHLYPWMHHIWYMMIEYLSKIHVDDENAQCDIVCETKRFDEFLDYAIDLVDPIVETFISQDEDFVRSVVFELTTGLLTNYVDILKAMSIKDPVQRPKAMSSSWINQIGAIRRQMELYQHWNITEIFQKAIVPYGPNWNEFWEKSTKPFCDLMKEVQENTLEGNLGDRLINCTETAIHEAENYFSQFPEEMKAENKTLNLLAHATEPETVEKKDESLPS